MSAPEVGWTDALETDELWEGDILDVEVEGEQILLVHHNGGEILAFQGMCPHQEVLLADGEWNDEAGTLECPGHKWEFDMRTGEGLNPTGCKLFRFPVRVTDEQIQVGIPNDGKRHYNRANES
ncbi:Rieske 2Fe-2S domain-containing protein [Rhodococcus sp. NPDC003382]|uniref:Rieske 2Fe-2S domain-containing protein n=1 Tax=unclassified Rhodococcus (in: high G+C Gram-positive bacteria) TaxID=192944 RepID=UPI0018CE840A|nr:MULTISPECIES: Rieske 2Fe-2S domain-containing protein [unclassified Rhodococcus (in: high G+C Gram-positive bacteria)]MBH0121732.1 Rieske 2Fe-2S domain-containing protein [Rhodococcus sp. CX]MCK8673744.1 Rieske 2Fe-2S domain-containing protein [Rhodococcus sp. HM1]